MIAFHSPDVLLETGLRICPPEKSPDIDATRSRVVSSLQSGSSKNNHELRALVAYFSARRPEVLCSADLLAERAVSR